MPVMSHDDAGNVTSGINSIIKAIGINTNNISDGYHTFGELYEHRFELYKALCRAKSELFHVWMAKIHSDGSQYEGWFLLGIHQNKGMQISYHLPIDQWNECALFATIVNQAPEWDGHTSTDVLERLKQL